MTSISDNLYSISKEHWYLMPKQYRDNCVYLARSSKFLGREVTYTIIESPENSNLLKIIMTNLVAEDLTFLKLSGIDVYLEFYPNFTHAIREAINHGSFTYRR